MTTEPTQPTSTPIPTSAPAVDSPEFSAGAASQGHRRRRRRRKNKSANPVPLATGGDASLPEFSSQQPMAISASQPQQRPEGAPFKSSRRKKRRNKQQQNGGFKPEPGNSILPVNGFNGKKKAARQKGPREFVGPMDHSYRVANGNVADGPPATSSQAGNGNFYADPGTRNHRTPAVAAPSRIFFVIEDLFFTAKINEVSRKLGVKVEFVKADKEKSDKDIVARLAETADPEHPSLVVFDLNNAAVKSLTLIPKVKSKLKKSVSIIGFLSHIQGDLKIKAIEAGCDTVMPRSAFSQSLPNLLRRYGIDDDDEYYPQPV